MPKRNCASAEFARLYLAAAAMATTVSCAAPAYTVRPAPVPVESAEVLRVERAISALQAETFEQQHAVPLRSYDVVNGLAVQRIVERLARVAERSHLGYQAYLYAEEEPNAAALADGRIYISHGMLQYLASRGSRADELAFVLAHELAHTAAQHLVQRYRRLQQHSLLMGLVSAGASAATANVDGAAREVGQLAVDAASLLNDVALSGYSQAQELEADQLGMRYLTRTGFDPTAAVELLRDFSRFDTPWPFMRTHPYAEVRRQYLQRYLTEQERTAGSPRQADTHHVRERLKTLRDAQRLYPMGSVSWANLQRQIDVLEASER